MRGSRSTEVLTALHPSVVVDCRAKEASKDAVVKAGSGGSEVSGELIMCAVKFGDRVSASTP
jgi:co-chaperonin GroES (HSP10)